MTMHSESFWSISKITKWLVILSIAIIVIALINTGAFFALNYQTEDAQLQSIEWKNSPRSNIIIFWWVLFLLSIFIGIPGEFITPPESEELSYNNTYTEQSMPIYVGLLNILSTIPAIVSTFFFIGIIRQISAWQEIKSGKSI